MERLPKKGMTFTRAYANSPLCSPTRATILTGQNPTSLGRDTGWELKDGTTTENDVSYGMGFVWLVWRESRVGLADVERKIHRVFRTRLIFHRNLPAGAGLLAR